MASTQTFSEGNGANAGTETASRSEMNWKNIDDSTTAYSSSLVSAGNNSYSKAQAIVFAGTWNSLSALTVVIDSISWATGLTITGSIRSASFTPGTGAVDSALTLTPSSINFTGTTWAGAFAAGSSSSTAGGTLYTQPLRTQLQTTSSAGPGDIATRTFTWSWTES